MPVGHDAKRDAMELIVLSILSEGDRYGYAISKQVAARSDDAMRLTPGVLYPLLHELEDDALVTAHWDAVKADDAEGSRGRRRKWYRLTAKGRKRLAKCVAAYRRHHAIIESFLPGAEGDAG